MYVCTYKHIIHVYCNITSISKVLSFPSLRKSLNKNMDFNVCFTTIIVIIIIMSSTFLFVCLIFIIFPLYLVPCFISSSMGLRGNVLQFRPWTCDTKTRTLHKETAATSQTAIDGGGSSSRRSTILFSASVIPGPGPPLSSSPHNDVVQLVVCLPPVDNDIVTEDPRDSGLERGSVLAVDGLHHRKQPTCCYDKFS